jgi:hypothetical protein
MWHPSENFLIKYHIAGSIATLVCCTFIVSISLVPTLFPGVYRLLVDERVIDVIPYVIFIALGEAVFSIWYFLFRK